MNAGLVPATRRGKEKRVHFDIFPSGAFGVAVGYPLDTVKVRIQTQRNHLSVWQCALSIVRTEGLRGFYKGMSMPVTTVSISSSVVFGTYRNVLQCLSQLRHSSPEAPPTKLHIFLSGLAGGVAQVSVMAPADIVKVRLQCQTEPYKFPNVDFKPKYRGPVHCLLTIAREEGILGLYKGAGALALRDGPSFAIYFLTYNSICSWLTEEHHKKPEWKVVLLAGGISGTCGWCVGTPMDVIKARLQMDGMGEKSYRGFFHCITKSVRTEGPKVLFKGLGLNCVRAFPVNMAVFAMYEVVVRFLHSVS
ncbi:solute carrier family 25 member 47-B isoform X2 [Denticeps clupeoides]|uniref:solute carrier family 25 member 47-B isoform X2 n=1 Tax=Denticeps clupeoides TaxID=299321 RepID=UPI0010A3E3DD|nr:solute carrier family 25 member 47 isoform X2 [Denticeps clupeoides]